MRIGLQQSPLHTIGSERNTAVLHSGVKQSRQDCVLADVFGDVLLTVICSHLLLVDILFEDVTDYVRIDLVTLSERAIVESPLPVIEKLEEFLECLVWYLNFWIASFELVN